MIDWLVTQLQTNNIFNGVVGASIIGILGLSIREIWGVVKLRLILSVSANSEYSGYSELVKWVSTLEHVKESKNINIGVSYNDSNAEYEIKSTIAYGTHYSIYKGRIMRIISNLNNATTTINRDLRVEIFPVISNSLINKILDEIKSLSLPADPTLVPIYNYKYSEWRIAKRATAKNLDEIILPPETKSLILNDLNAFLSSKEWYYHSNIAYKRNYLFYGLPGCGKSSLILSLAKHLEYKVCYLDMNGNNDAELIQRFLDMPSRSILVIEDIDCAGGSTYNRNSLGNEELLEANTARHSLSTLLNLLDGPLSKDEIIVIMTTNHLENIDGAITRSMRTDLLVELKPLTESLARQMIYKSLAKEENLDIDFFDISNKLTVPAALQEEIIRYKYTKGE